MLWRRFQSTTFPKMPHRRAHFLTDLFLHNGEQEQQRQREEVIDGCGDRVRRTDHRCSCWRCEHRRGDCCGQTADQEEQRWSKTGRQIAQGVPEGQCRHGWYCAVLRRCIVEASVSAARFCDSCDRKAVWLLLALFKWIIASASLGKHQRVLQSTQVYFPMAHVLVLHVGRLSSRWGRLRGAWFFVLMHVNDGATSSVGRGLGKSARAGLEIREDIFLLFGVFGTTAGSLLGVLLR